MNVKELGDGLVKYFSRGNSANEELKELAEYFRLYGPIIFEFEVPKGENITIAASKNYRHGSIITSGRNPQELDDNIKDAILTAFEVPSVYATEAGISKLGDNKSARYAVA